MNLTMFDGIKTQINTFRNPSVQQAVSAVGNGLFSLVGSPKQTHEVAEKSPYQQQAQRTEPSPQPSYSMPPVANFSAPIEQVEKNLHQEAKINARKICAELRKRGVTMRVLFTLIVKDLEQEQKLVEFEKLNDIELIDDLTDLPEDIRLALSNKIKLEKFTQLTTNLENDLLELLEDTLFQKYRLEYMAGKHEMLSELDIIEMYTSIMMTPLYELGADILVEKALVYKKPVMQYGQQLLHKFLDKASKISPQQEADKPQE